MSDRHAAAASIGRLERNRTGVLASVPIILSSVSLNAIAQLLLKRGMVEVGHFDLAAGQLATVLPKVVLSPFVVGGIASYALSIGLWLVVLSRVDVSAAYPFLSIGFVISAVIGFWLFGESLGPARILGITLVCAGVVMISRS